jgi:hypothetical protein
MPSGITAVASWPKRGSGRGTPDPIARRARRYGVPADLAERDGHPDLLQQPQLLQQEGLTAGHLDRRRLVRGRCAAERRGDVGVAQDQAIAAPTDDG